MSERVKRTKLQIQVSENIEKRISEKAEEFGMSKSAYCAFIIGTHLDQLDKMDNALNVMANQVAKMADINAPEQNSKLK